VKTFLRKDLGRVGNLGYLRYLGYLGVIGIGMGIGLVVSGEKSVKSEPDRSIQLVQSEESVESFRSVKSEKSVEKLLLSAQALLTQAIAISKENKNDQQMHTRNEKIVTLINEAIRTTNQAIIQYPSDPRPWAQRAKIYQTIKQYLPEGEKVAIADWQRAIKLDPRNAEYCQNLAKLYLNKGEIKSALFYLQKAVEANPTNPNLLKELAEQQTKAGWLRQAKINYQRLLSLLTNEQQKEAIKKEIAHLEKLMAQAAADKTLSQQTSLEPPREITLPDSPPLLEARDLAGGLIIAAPEENKTEDLETKTETNALSGTAVLPAGETEIKICNDNLSPTSQVYLAPESDSENQVLMVKRKAPYNPDTGKCSHFVVGIQKPLTKDLRFRWWIIN